MVLLSTEKDSSTLTFPAAVELCHVSRPHSGWGCNRAESEPEDRPDSAREHNEPQARLFGALSISNPSWKSHVHSLSNEHWWLLRNVVKTSQAQLRAVSPPPFPSTQINCCKNIFFPFVITGARRIFYSKPKFFTHLKCPFCQKIIPSATFQLKMTFLPMSQMSCANTSRNVHSDDQCVANIEMYLLTTQTTSLPLLSTMMNELLQVQDGPDRRWTWLDTESTKNYD